ncbi:gliding motility-associated-like protein [Chitinophaga skermanii]|uniref:Gliding motility-associated-like protein n=1 Tax=Chitinophaga skermanii TaxID=331697 RepID=A0A327Q1C9_9BACT|nr:gliding motility-associated C-terminal domain-containing protein [Chitinophaga skermanii]RAI97531.1 gliding motility-associated-like protein [Chitinophaga skermanii]
MKKFYSLYVQVLAIVLCTWVLPLTSKAQSYLKTAVTTGTQLSTLTKDTNGNLYFTDLDPSAGSGEGRYYVKMLNTTTNNISDYTSHSIPFDLLNPVPPSSLEFDQFNKLYVNVFASGLYEIVASTPFKVNLPTNSTGDNYPSGNPYVQAIQFNKKNNNEIRGFIVSSNGTDFSHLTMWNAPNLNGAYQNAASRMADDYSIMPGATSDPAGNHYFIDLVANKRILKLQYTGGNNFSQAMFLSGKYYSSIASDKDGNLYVTESTDGRNFDIVKYSPTAVELLRIPNALVGSYGGLGGNDFEQPRGMVVMPNGTIYANSGNESTTGGYQYTMYKFEPDVKVLSVLPIQASPVSVRNNEEFYYIVSGNAPLNGLTKDNLTLVDVGGNIQFEKITDITFSGNDALVYVNSGYANTGQLRLTVASSSSGLSLTSAPVTSITTYVTNLAPSVDGTSTSITYTEGDPAINLHNSIVASDDGTILRGVSVYAVSGGENSDSLIFVNTDSTQFGRVQASYSVAAKTLTISLVDPNDTTFTIAKANRVLNAVQFKNTSQNPSATPIVYRFTATDWVYGTTGTSTVSVTVNKVGVNDAPVITGPANTISLTNIQTLEFKDSTLITVSDPDINPGSGDYTITATHGVIRVFSTGAESASVSGTTTMANLNSLLRYEYSYAPGFGYFGPATITITFNDKGNSPPPAQTGTYTMNLDIVPGAAAVTSITATGTGNSKFGIGQTVAFNLTFSEPVKVSNTPTITINTTPVRTLNYVTGSGTNTLTFNYVVQPGDVATALDVTSLSHNDGFITNLSGLEAYLGLPPTKIAPARLIEIDGVVPTFTQVAPPANKTYKYNELMVFTVSASEVLDTANLKQLTLQVTIGDTVRAVPVYNYTVENGVTKINFNYHVQPFEVDNDGVVIGSLELPTGLAVKDQAGNEVTNFAIATIPATTAVLVNAAELKIIDFKIPADGGYKINDELRFVVRFNQPIWSFSAAQFKVNINGVDRLATAAYAGDSIVYTVPVFWNDPKDTLHVPTAIGLYYNTIKGLNTDMPLVDPSLPYRSAANVIIDGVPPTGNWTLEIPNVTTGRDSIPYKLKFTEPVTGVIPSKFTVSIGGGLTGVIEGFTNINDTTYTFYVKITGTGIYSLSLNSTFNINDIKDAVGNPLSNSLLTPAPILIDRRAPTATSFNPPNSKTYAIGEQLLFGINYNMPIVATGTIRLPLYLGTDTIYVPLSYVSGNTNYIFYYTVKEGDVDTDGIKVGVMESDSAMTSEYGIPLVPAQIPNAILVNTKVDGIRPYVTAVSASPASLLLKVGSIATTAITFNEQVTVSGAPTATLQIGNRTVNATYTATNGNDLVFQYTIVEGDEAPTGFEVVGFKLNGGTIKDVVGNETVDTASAVFPVTGSKVDGVSPTIIRWERLLPERTNATALTYRITYSEPVNGNISLFNQLNGLTVLSNTMVKESDTSFIATIQVSGSGTLTPTTIASTIVDLANNPSTSTAVTGPSYTVDQAAPSIVRVETADSTYREGQNIFFDVVFDEAVKYTGTVYLPLKLATLPNTSAIAVSQTNDSTVRFRFTVPANARETIGVQAAYNISNGITDTLGNAYAPIATIIRTVAKVDAVRPNINNVTIPAKTYHIGDSLDVNIVYDEAVTVVDSPMLKIRLNGNNTEVLAKYLGKANASTVTFRYIVEEDVVPTISDITIFGNVDRTNGSVTDMVGNLSQESGYTYTLADCLIDAVRPVVTSLVLEKPDARTPAFPADMISLYFHTSEKINTPSLDMFNLTFTNGLMLGTGTNVTAIDDTTYRIVFDMSGNNGLDGTVTAAVPGITNLTDIAGNVLTQAITSNAYYFDRKAPAFTTIDLPTAKTYKIGDTLTYVLHTNEPITLTGAPRLNVSSNGISFYANYDSHTDTTITLKAVTVATNANNASTVIDNILELNGSTIVDLANNDIQLTVPTANTTNIRLDGKRPGISSLGYYNNRTFKVGDVVNLTVYFDEKVTVQDTLRFYMKIGNKVAVVPGVFQSNGTEMRFDYTVVAGDSGVIAYDSLAYGIAVVRDIAGNDLVQSPQNVVTTSIADAVGPKVTAVTVTPASAMIGTTISANVQFNEAVNFQSSAKVYATVNGQAVIFDTPTAGSGHSIDFTLTVTEGLEARNSIHIDSISYVTDVNDNALQNPVNIDAAIDVIDAVRPQVISFTRLDANPNNLQEVSYQLVFSEKMKGTIQNAIQFNTTGTLGVAGLSAASTDNITYTIKPRFISGVGTLHLSLKQGYLTDSIGNTLTAADQMLSETFYIDRIAPVVDTVLVPADSTYKKGETLHFAVQYSKPVTVTGTDAYMNIVIGAATKQATFVSSNNNTLQFAYTVAEGDLDTDGIVVDPTLVLGTTTIVDSVNNAAATALANMAPTNAVFVNGVTPAVTSIVAGVANNRYKIGSTLPIDVTFNQAMNISNSVTMELKLGGDTKYATLNTVTGNTAIFNYTVQEGDPEVNIVTTGNFVLNGGAIKTQQGVNLTGTLSDTSFTSRFVDGIRPYVTSVVTDKDSTKVIPATNVAYTFAFNEYFANWSVSTFEVVTTGTLNATMTTLQNIATNSIRVDLNTAGSGTLTLKVKSPNAIVDIAGNAMAAGEVVGTTLRIDNDRPTITGIIPPADSTYRLGNKLQFGVQLSEPLASALDDLQLNLITTNGVPAATYDSTSADGKTIFLSYIVAAGDKANGIELFDTLRTVAAYGPPYDSAGWLLDMNIPSAFQQYPNINIDATSATVTTVTVPDSTYKLGDVITATATFSTPVTAQGNVQLPIQIGASNVLATVTPVTNSTTVMFTYTVQAGDFDMDGISFNAPIDLNGGTITTINSQRAATLTIPATTLSNAKVDGIRPTIQSITASASPMATGNYKFTVTFSERMRHDYTSADIVTGTAVLNNSYVNIQPSVTVFEYNGVVTGGDGTATLDFSKVNLLDEAGNTLDTTGVNIPVIIIANKPATITNITVPADSTYRLGNVMNFDVTFDQALTIVDPANAPRLPFTIDGNIVKYASHTGTTGNTYHFQYTVVADDMDADGIVVGDKLLGSLQNQYNVLADTTINNIPNTANIRIDAKAPVATTVKYPAADLYGIGQTIQIKVGFNEAVTYTGTPKLSIILKDGSVVFADVVNGNHTDTLTFQYTVKEGDEKKQLAVSSTIDLTASTITDMHGNNLVNTLPNITTAKVIDGVRPTITSYTLLSASPMTTGQVNIRLITSEPLTPITTQWSSFTTTGNVQLSNFSEVQAINTIYFTTNVNGGDGTITHVLPIPTDLAGNTADTTGLGKIIIDVLNSAPAITNITVPADSIYRAGEVLRFNVTYNQAVTLADAANVPYLPFTIGTKAVKAVHVSNNGNIQSFEYTVQTGELDTDGIEIGTAIRNQFKNALGTIADSSIIGTPSTANVKVDAVQPKVVSVKYPTAGRNGLGAVLNFEVTFDEPVVYTGAPIISLPFNNATRTATILSGNGTNTLVFTYTVQTGDQQHHVALANAISTVAGSSITDIAGNNAILTLPTAPATSGVHVDGIIPVVTGVKVIPSTSSNAQQVRYVVAYSEKVLGANIGLFNIQTTGTLTYTWNIYHYNDSTILAADVTGAGKISFSLNSPNNMKDSSGNPLAPYTNVVSTIIDNVRPTVNISTTAANRINTPFPVNVVFSKPVTGFLVNDISVTNGAITGFTGSGANYSFTVTPMTDGVATVSIPANGAIDSLGNQNLASADTIRINYDRTPPVVTPVTFAINEKSSVGAVLGTIYATDASNIFTDWRIDVNTDQNNNGVPDFVLNATTGKLTINDADLRYLVSHTLTIQVSVTDGLNRSAQQAIIINLLSINNAPTGLTLSKNSILENNASGATVGTFTTIDTDADDTHTYTLVTGTGDTDNAAFSILGNALRINQVTNYEAKNTYSIRVRTTDKGGLFFDQTFIINVVDVNEAPTVGTIAAQKACATTETHTITVQNVTPGPETSQTITPTITADNNLFDVLTASYNATAKTVTITYRLKANATGNAFVTLTVQDNGGTANGGIDKVSTSFMFTVNAVPVVTISSDKGLNVSKGATVVLTATGGLSYTWSNADGIITGINSPALTVRPMQNTTYTVTAKNADGCTGTASVNMTVIEDFKIDATNVLTPNGDGVNDRWVIKNIDAYPQNEVKIFDRAGRMVYYKKGYLNEWDGKVNGRPLAEGTYYFIVDFGPNLPKSKGFITLVNNDL